MQMKKNDSRGWLFLGLSQLALSLSCSPGNAALTYTPNMQDPNAYKTYSADGSSLPVRVSRSFFGKSLTGQIKIESKGQGFSRNVARSIDWVEKPTTQDPPQPGALSDFRDHEGCAHYRSLGDLAVCFTIMGDVYSVGLNPREMKLQGLEEFVKEELNQQQPFSSCEFDLKNVRFDQAQRGETQFTVHLSATAVPQKQCGIEKLPLAIQLQLSQE